MDKLWKSIGKNLRELCIICFTCLFRLFIIFVFLCLSRWIFLSHFGTVESPGLGNGELGDGRLGCFSRREEDGWFHLSQVFKSIQYSIASGILMFGISDYFTRTWVIGSTWDKELINTVFDAQFQNIKAFYHLQIKVFCYRLWELTLQWTLWPADEDDEEELDDSEIKDKTWPKWKIWLDVEASREANHWLPWRPDQTKGQSEEDCEDPDRQVRCLLTTWWVGPNEICRWLLHVENGF